MKITKKACKALCRLAAAHTVPVAYSPADDGKEIMFTDSRAAVCIRVPADYMRHIDGVAVLHGTDTRHGDVAARAFAWIDSHDGYTPAAVTPAHGRRSPSCRAVPVLRDDLRKFATYRRRADKRPAYPLGKGFYNPSYIALVLDVLPDAVIYAAGPLDPLYIVGENGCAFVMPLNVPPHVASDARADLEQFRNAATAADNAPKLENQPEKVTGADVPADAASTQPAHNDGANAFRAVSSSTLVQLMQQKGIPCSGKYAEIDSFYAAILRAGETLPAVDGETWSEFLERAYPVAFPDATQQGSHYDFDKAYNNIPAAVEAFYTHARHLHGETLFGVRFDHVDGSGFWFSYELTHDNRRQVYCVRHADLDSSSVQHSPHFDQQPPKAGCRLPGGDGIIDPVNLEWMRIMVSDWMADQGLTDDDIVIDWDGFSEQSQSVPCRDSSHCYLLEAVHGDIHIVPIGTM